MLIFYAIDKSSGTSWKAVMYWKCHKLDMDF